MSADLQLGPVKSFDFNGDGREDLMFSQQVCQGLIPTPGGGVTCAAQLITYYELLAQDGNTFAAAAGAVMTGQNPTNLYFAN